MSESSAAGRDPTDAGSQGVAGLAGAGLPVDADSPQGIVDGRDTTAALLEAGERALEAGAWARAREQFAAAIERDESGRAWEGLSWAGWWLCEADPTLSARERAYRLYRSEDDRLGAARMALWLANDVLDFRADVAVGLGWLERARALLADDATHPERGWLAVIEAYYALEIDADPAAAQRAARIARRLGHELEVPDLEALGIALEGEAQIFLGEVAPGIRSLDQAGALLSGEEFEEPAAPVLTLCVLISACERICDTERVMQWCRVLRPIGERFEADHVIGGCRTSYGQVLAIRGDWSAAERELVEAAENLEASRAGLLPGALVRLGRLRERQGDLDEARALFERALPHPAAALGLARLELEDGDPRAAAEAAERALRRLPEAAVIERVPALELVVRARAELGDLDAATQAMRELDERLGDHGPAYVRGQARLARAALAIAKGNEDEARRDLEDACDFFSEAGAPYEAARARLELAKTLIRCGRSDRGRAEATKARQQFASLGAQRDIERAEAIDAPSHDDDAAKALAELTPREREVLRLVAEGLSDAQIAERLVVSPHTVHRHVANIRAKLRLPSRAAAAAYAARAGAI